MEAVLASFSVFILSPLGHSEVTVFLGIVVPHIQAGRIYTDVDVILFLLLDSGWLLLKCPSSVDSPLSWTLILKKWVVGDILTAFDFAFIIICSKLFRLAN